MKIVIDTEKREIRESWSDTDRKTEYRTLQRTKLEAISMALGAQLVIMYDTNKDRTRMLSAIFSNLIDSMKQAVVGDSEPDQK